DGAGLAGALVGAGDVSCFSHLARRSLTCEFWSPARAASSAGALHVSPWSRAWRYGSTAGAPRAWSTWSSAVPSSCRATWAVADCAGAVGNWGRYQDFHQGNVVVTENVVEGCLKARVRRLVHLSSPSIYFTGRSRLDIREDQLPRRFHDHYATTKYLAEQKV